MDGWVAGQVSLGLFWPIRNSSEIAAKEQNLLPKSCRSTLLELKTIKQILKIWKMTSIEDASMEDSMK